MTAYGLSSAHPKRSAILVPNRGEATSLYIAFWGLGSSIVRLNSDEPPPAYLKDISPSVGLRWSMMIIGHQMSKEGMEGPGGSLAVPSIGYGSPGSQVQGLPGIGVETMIRYFPRRFELGHPLRFGQSPMIYLDFFNVCGFGIMSSGLCGSDRKLTPIDVCADNEE